MVSMLRLKRTITVKMVGLTVDEQFSISLN